MSREDSFISKWLKHKQENPHQESEWTYEFAIDIELPNAESKKEEDEE